MAGARAEIGAFSGRCMCGRVACEAAVAPAEMALCFCADCRRATGVPDPGFVSVESAHIRWTGTPRTRPSSAAAERGFCADCGTPLFYRARGGTTALTAGAADLDFRPSIAFYRDDCPDWLASLQALPGKAHAPAADQGPD